MVSYGKRACSAVWQRAHLQCSPAKIYVVRSVKMNVYEETLMQSFLASGEADAVTMQSQRDV